MVVESSRPWDIQSQRPSRLPPQKRRLTSTPYGGPISLPKGKPICPSPTLKSSLIACSRLSRLSLCACSRSLSSRAASRCSGG